MRPCPDHEEGGSDGLVTFFYPGALRATHATAPMFTLKPYMDGHGKVFCAICDNPTDNTFDDLNFHREQNTVNIFNDLYYELDLKHAVPDYTLSEKVSHP